MYEVIESGGGQNLCKDIHRTNYIILSLGMAYVFFVCRGIVPNASASFISRVNPMIARASYLFEKNPHYQICAAHHQRVT